VCFDCFPQKILCLRRILRYIIKNVCWSLCKTPTIIVVYFRKLEFSLGVFRKIDEYKILLKSVQWKPSGCIRTDRRTGVTKLVVAFRNFANAPENVSSPLFYLVLTNLIGAIPMCIHLNILRVSSVKTELKLHIKWKCALSLDVPQTWFNNWPDDDSSSRNMSPI
jgi:uncharacterized membrane protein YecN with MAPEG domain